MKSTRRFGTISVVLVALALVASTVAFAGGVSGVQTDRDAPSAVTDDAVAASNSVNESESVCDGDVNAKLPGNCKVHITVVSIGVDTEDDLAGFLVRNDGYGETENLTYRYETSEGESGTAGFGFNTFNTSEDGSVTLKVYYDGELVEEVRSDTDTPYDFGPTNDGTEDDGTNDDGTDEKDDSKESDEKEDC